MNKRRVKYVKAVTAIAVAASAVVVIAPIVPEASGFKDVQQTHQFYEAIKSLSERGIINGFQDGTFKPGQNLTRGQAAKIIAGVLELNTKNVNNPNFKDIPATHQYYGAIAALKQAGIIDGYEDGTFRQGENIQRNHVAKIIAYALNLKAKNTNSLPFTDVRADYKDAIAALFENNVTTGKTATLFDGSSNVTRGQMAAFITRAEAAGTQNPQPAQSVIFKVEDYTATGIVINGTAYSYQDAVKSIFTETNKAALTGASITATVENGILTKVNNVTLNKNGTAESLVVFDTSATIDELIINADYAAVKNVKVTGNAIITSDVLEVVKFENSTIISNLIVDDKVLGAIASLDNKFANAEKAGPNVNLKNSLAAIVQVKRSGVSLESDQAIPEVDVAAAVTTIGLNGIFSQVIVKSATKLEIAGNATIDQIVLIPPVELFLRFGGTVNTLTVSNSATQISMDAGLKIKELQIPKDSKAAQIIKDYAAVASQISAIIGGDKPTTSNPGTGTPSTDGGSGTSNPIDPPVVGEKKYNVRNIMELNLAIKSAKRGDTIKLLASVTGDIALTNLVNIDLNGQKLTGNVTITAPTATGTYSLAPTGGTGIITGKLVINAPNVNITIDGLTVEGETVIE